MGVTLNSQDFIIIIQAIAAEIENNKDYLSELDGAVGDGDHGVSMTIGFRAVLEQLPKVADSDVGTILKATGMALVSNVGAAMGPLYGTGFMRAGKAVEGKSELTQTDLADMFMAFCDGIMQRGKAQVGDKTMIDTIHPSCTSFQHATEQGDDLFTALDKMVDAAEQGMVSTIDLIAKLGRSSRLGERTRGHQDAGATSSYIMFKTIASKIKELKSE